MTDPRRPGGMPTSSRANEARPERPRRPMLVEVAAAVLIVGGAISALVTISLAVQQADQGTASPPLILLSLAIAVASIVLGVLVRSGRAWLVAVNVAAVAGFLELMDGTPQGVMLGLIDVFVVLALFRERPWFTWSPDGPDEDEAEDG